ncbi:Uncharacterised protein [Mycobacterium tuberculosis]|nr:Uncharacterised protein [Mycobacterium tuberculosis]
MSPCLFASAFTASATASDHGSLSMWRESCTMPLRPVRIALAAVFGR